MTAIEDARAVRARFDNAEIAWDDSPVALRNALDALIAEYERIAAARDEVQEKIAYLRRNCMGIPEQELRQKIGAVGEAEWKLGYYWNTLVAEERDRATRAEVAQREAEREVERLTAPPTDDEREALIREVAVELLDRIGAQRLTIDLVRGVVTEWERRAGFRRIADVPDASAIAEAVMRPRAYSLADLSPAFREDLRDMVIEAITEARRQGPITDAQADAGAWAILDRNMDTADRAPSKEAYEDALADARAALQAARGA